MNGFISMMTIALNVAICVRLITYKPDPNSRYRPGISFLAWLMVVFAGAQAIHLLVTKNLPTTDSPYSLGMLIVLAVLIYRSGGNVARILGDKRNAKH